VINDRLRDALLTARLTPEDLATDLGVNPKTVERWITRARLPYPQFRHRISVLVGKSESSLWPDALAPRRRAEIAESEIVRIYPYRADVPADLWARLFENAIDSIGILVYSGFFLPEQYAPQMKLLKKKADDGASIRILLGDPDCPQVAQKGHEEDIGDAIAAKIRNVLLAYYAPYADYPGINIRLHATTLYNSIYWFDDDMLVNTHAYGVPAAFAPVLHLRHLSSGTLFQTYARSFDRVWDQTHKTWTGHEAAEAV
jgi:transcriptional regulator with XRE-family HTH domain